MTIQTSREAATWPGLDVVPSGPRAAVSAAVARRLFSAAVDRLPVTVHLEYADRSGRVLGLGGPAMTVHRPDEFFARLGRHGLIGFGESYLTGAWESADLAGFLSVLAADLPSLIPAPLQKARALVVARPPRAQRSTSENSRNNIAHHYDLSNDLFRTFLDETLSYSSALFDTPVRRHEDHLVAIPPGGESAESLADAQARKIERLLDVTGVGNGTRLLEIGTGWGELALRAARRGATVRTITLSTEQLALARRRVSEAGLADRVSVELLDYRDVVSTSSTTDNSSTASGSTTETYDAVVSVEMIEAVGHDFWPDYFRTLDRLLAPGGKVGLQAIVMPHDRMLATRHTHTWINKYIFPGGFLPSVRAIEQVTREHTSLHIADRLSFGSHYAETLRRWDDAFRASHDRVRELGFDSTFERMWHFYLEYSRSGFASGYLDVQQIVLAR
jgi:cyclopropane-fatty-acyl-phospholipid synthase